MRFSFILVGFLLLSSFAKSQDLAQAWKHPEWKTWLSQYASSSPWLAKKKNEPAHFLTDEKYLDPVIAGNSKLEFDKALQLKGVSYEKYDIFKSVEARRFEVFDQIEFALLGLDQAKKSVVVDEDRNRVMRDELIKLITSRKEDELNLFVTDAAQSYDLFFRYYLVPDMSATDPRQKLNSELAYVGFPKSDETAFFTQSYEDFVSATRGVKQETEKVQDHSLNLSIGFLARLYYYNNLSRNLVPKEAITKERPIRFGNLVFMHTRYLRQAEPFSTMPGPQALKAVGVKKIRVALEGLQIGKKYSSDDLHRFYRIQATNRYSDEDVAYFKKFRPKAYAIYDSNFITDLSMHALHEKLKSYEAAGIEVEYLGLESSE